MLKKQKYSIPTLGVAAVLSVCQPTPAIAAELTAKESSSSQITITVQENGEISSLKPSNPDTKLRAAGERAPDCINAVPEKGFVQVYNNCDWDIRVKVIFVFAPDSQCKLVIAGTRTNIAPHYARIGGVETC